MSTSIRKLSEVCQAARIIDLETNKVVEYATLEVLVLNHIYHTPNPPTRYYLIYWPFGVFAYVATHFQLHELRPSFVEAAYKSAKKTRPFSPPMSRYWP